MKRPPSTVAGVLLVFLRVLAGLIVVVSILLDWRNTLKEVDVSVEGVESSPELAQAALIGVVILLGVVLVVDAALALFILTGHNWARVTVMAFSAISITGSFIQWWSEDQEITITRISPDAGPRHPDPARPLQPQRRRVRPPQRAPLTRSHRLAWIRRSRGGER